MNNNVFDDTVDYKNGSTIYVYLKDKDYYVTGNFKRTDEGADKKYLVLNMFRKFSVADNQIIEDFTLLEHSENASIMIKFDDIDYIEVFNNHFGEPESEKSDPNELNDESENESDSDVNNSQSCNAIPSTSIDKIMP